MKRYLLALVALCGLSAIGGYTLAGEVRLSWDASPTPGVAYRIYGARQGQPKALLGTVTETTSTRTGVLPGTHCYHVTAYSADGLESEPSNEACKTVAETPVAPLPPVNLRIE